MSHFYDMDDEVLELVDQLRAPMKLTRSELIGLALALLAARMHVRLVPPEE